MDYDYIECGDCVQLMKSLPDECIDITVTSPPYDDLRTYTGYTFDFESTANELYRITKQGGVVVWIVNDGVVNRSETGTSFKQALYFKECGFYIHDTMIWNKGSCAFPDSNRYFGVFEYMFVFSKGKPKTFNPIMDKKNKHAGKEAHGTERQKDGSTKKITRHNVIKEYGRRTNVWEMSGASNNKTGHPAVFPMNLAIDHILSWSNENDIVLDPFLGSGTTALAAFKTNRHYIGFEISEKYFDIACKRLDEAETNAKSPKQIMLNID